MSSFSLDFEIASEFAGSNAQGGALVGAVIPANRILSTPLTGFGCAREAEMVTIGGHAEMFISAWQPGTQIGLTKITSQEAADRRALGDAYTRFHRDLWWQRYKEAVKPGTSWDEAVAIAEEMSNAA